MRAVLALWVERCWAFCQDTVTLALAHGLRGPRNPQLRRLQRELLYDPTGGSGPGAGGRALFRPAAAVGAQLVGAHGRAGAGAGAGAGRGRTSKQDDGGPGDQCGLSPARHSGPWHIVRAQASWIDHFCRLLRLLAPAVPVTVPVRLCDQGLGSRNCGRRLWLRLASLPALPAPRHLSARGPDPTRAGALAEGPGGLWVGTGRAFRDQPLYSTLHAHGQAQPWVLLTDTPVAETEPTLYACRNWIEQGFRGLKTVGWKWHKTRRLTRVGRHWLVLAIATLLAVAYGTRREEAEARHREPGRLRRPPAELLLQQGVALLRRLLLRGYLWACVWLRPTPGPDFRTRLRRLDPGGT